jgi:zinc transport system substrate-binding protein
MKKIFCILIFLIVGNSSYAIDACATVSPLYGILAYITKDTDKTTLILDRANSDLHSYALTPSDALKIKKCDIIFMVNSEFETFSSKFSKLSKKNSKIIEVSEAKNIKLLEMRENNIFEEEDVRGHDHAFYDYHIWLDTDNVKSIAKMIAEELSKEDPKNEKIYQTNLSNFITKLGELDKDLTGQLSAIKDQPFIVFHDAYQYFENKYGLKSVGAILVNEEHNLSAESFASIKELVAENKVKCIFAEPQFPTKIIDKIASSSKVGHGVLNAEWASADKAEDIYFMIMRNLATSLVGCLK